jgi:nicotinamidase-related amidase
MTSIASSPYRWPYNGELHGSDLAFVVVEAPATLDDVIPSSLRTRLDAVARGVQAAGGTIIHVSCRFSHAQPTVSSALTAPSAPLLQNADADFTSDGIDGFYCTPLEGLLRATDRHLVVLGGTWFETSVHSTMREANDRGFECLALTDVCACLDESIRTATISQIEMSGGIFGAVSTSDQLLAAL